MVPSPKISIVMSTYNRKKDLLECLQSIRNNNYPNLEIVLVDNGCEDGTRDAVQGAFPDVRVVRTEKNLGSVGGINLGIRDVPQDAEYILFLDDDYILKDGAIQELINAIHDKPEYGAATARVLYFENPAMVQVAGSSVGLYTGINYMNSGPDHKKYHTFFDTEGIGGTGLVKKAVVDQVGLWDETYYYYYEDPDFSLRILEAGYKIRYVPTSVILHKLPIFSREEGKKRWFARAYWVARNKIIFMRKHSKCFPFFVLFYPFWVAVYTYQAVRYGNPKVFWEFSRGIVAGFSWAFSRAREAK